MSSYLSSLLTTTTSKYNSLRRALLSDEADGDTEDDSHISRVLRAYYTEKGRPFPPWLPPDPKAPQPVATQFVTSNRLPQYQAPAAARMGASGSVGGGRGGLSDLWDAPQQQPAAQQEPVSLRRAAVGRGRGVPSRSGGMDPYAAQEPASQGRPLPSQKAGSYQNQFAQYGSRPPTEPSPPPPASSGSGSTAQERLKARLWGSGRSGSPSPSGTGSQSPSPSPALSQMSSRNPYEQDNPYQRDGRYKRDNSYSSRDNSYSSGPNLPYPDDRRAPVQGGGSERWDKRPYVSANSPWDTSGDPYGGGGGGPYDGSSRSSGPRPPGRDRVGLPNGPRLR